MSIEKKQSLAFVVSDINFFFSHRIDLAEKLSKKFEIYVLSDTLNIRNSKLLKNNSIKFVRIRARRSKNKLINFMSAIRYGINLIYLLKLNKIDNVFYITLESSIIGAVASKFLKNKLLCNHWYLCFETAKFKINCYKNIFIISIKINLSFKM